MLASGKTSFTFEAGDFQRCIRPSGSCFVMLRNCSSTGWHACRTGLSPDQASVDHFFKLVVGGKHLELQWLLLVDLLDNMIMPRSENVTSFFSSCNFPMFSQLAFRNRLLKHTLFHCFSQSLEARSVALPNSWHFLSAIFAPVSILRRSGDVV